jgi:preprotein translocase subunit SecD
VSRAQVVEDAGGFTLQIRFDRLGTQILENHTASRPGSRLAIFSEFGERLEKARWLAAPVIRHRISDGLLVFTPDADREEAGQIALGLNNLVRRSQPLFIKEPE